MLGFLIGPPIASADETRYLPIFELRGSNGFTVRVERKGPVVRLSAINQRVAARYTRVAAVPRKRGIDARFRELGRVSVRFRRNGPKQILRRPRSGCYEARTPGVFVGRIHFEGEEGFTQVDARRARGTLLARRGSCDTFYRASGLKATASGLVPTEVGLHAHNVGEEWPWVKFECSQGPGSDLAPPKAIDPEERYFFASVSQRYYGIFIDRLVAARSREPSSFTYNNALTEASVVPPAPFAGEATLTREERRFRGPWTGTLTASFPGAANVALAGPDFQGSMSFYDYEPAAEASSLIRLIHGPS